MKEVYILILIQEDYQRIYGIFDNYIQASEELKNLQLYNEYCHYGELKIFRYDINALYMKENNEEIK